MSEYRRWYVAGGVYFFTVVTHRRRAFFTSPDAVDLLRSAFRRVMIRRPFRVDAMVILPDHLHCIWTMPPDDWDFSGRWREIKKIVSRRVALAAHGRGEAV
jgi:putative transposase